MLTTKGEAMANTDQTHHHLPCFHLTSVSTDDLRLGHPLAAGDTISFRFCMGSHTIDVDVDDMDSSTSDPTKALINQPLHHPLPPAFTIQVLHKSAIAGDRQVAAASIPMSDVAVDGDFHRLLTYKLRGQHGEENGVVNLTAKLVGEAVGPVPLSLPSMVLIVPRIEGPYLEVSQISAEDLTVPAAEAYVVVRTGPASATTGVVSNGGGSPWWEDLLRLPVPAPAARPGCITVEVWCKQRRRWLAGDLLAAAAEVPISDIMDDYIPAESVHFLSYRLLNKKGERVGTVNFAVKLVKPAPEKKMMSVPEKKLMEVPVREDET